MIVSANAVPKHSLTIATEPMETAERKFYIIKLLKIPDPLNKIGSQI